MRLTGWVVILGSLAACGGDDSSPAVDGGGVQDGALRDGGSVDATAAADSAVVTPDAAVNGCGTGVQFMMGRVRIKYSGSQSTAGTVVTPSSCPTSMFTADATGRWNGEIGPNVPYYFRAVLTGFTTGLTQEHVGTPSGTHSTGTDTYLFDIPGMPTLFPEMDSTHAAAFGEVTGAAAGACSGGDGWVIGLPDHPEAHVIYMSTLGAADTSLTATTLARGVTITRINPGAPTRLLGTKGACTMDFTLGGMTTGKIPLEAGAIAYFNGGGV